MPEAEAPKSKYAWGDGLRGPSGDVRITNDPEVVDWLVGANEQAVTAAGL